MEASKGYNKAASPLGVIPPLATLALAVSPKARNEILRVIGVKNEDQLKDYYKNITNELDKVNDMEINIDTRIIVNHNLIQKDFNSSADQLFDVQLMHGDLDNSDLVKRINEMVKDNTHNYAKKDVISSASTLSNARFLVVTSIFIRAPWKIPFTSVGKSNFDNQLIRPFMKATANFNYFYSDRLKAELVLVPFEDARCSLLIILPGSKLSMNNKKDIYNATRHMKSTYMTIKMPRISMEVKVDPRTVLKGMGINSLFSQDETFDNMLDPKHNNKRNIKSWQIIQTTGINVNEEGFNFKNSHIRARNESPPSKESKPKVMNINKPFSFEVGCFQTTVLSGFIYRP